ncbi:general secretion pathway protein GspK [Candidatus Coxiella mudrowiae]|nr:general secretion pathway protein GspK [Candidatus Coxiella mudrowiae]
MQYRELTPPLFYEKLASHLTALPEDQCQININYDASIKSFFNTY